MVHAGTKVQPWAGASFDETLQGLADEGYGYGDVEQFERQRAEEYSAINGKLLFDDGVASEEGPPAG
jgi:hypothetical protein